MSLTDKLFHKFHPDMERYDKITIEVVPRYKTSGLSGDEWRISAAVSFWYKGHLIKRVSFRNMETAVMALGGEWVGASDTPVSPDIYRATESLCDQPGCAQKAAGRLALKRETARDGYWLDPSESYGWTKYRQFCLVHIERGDCGREDADTNYTPLDKVGAADTQNAEESPAAFGGVIDLRGDKSDA